MSFKEIHEKLLEPFDPADVEWRAGSFSEKTNKAMALAYITARAVMNRLDEVVGPENWQDSYEAISGADGDRGYICTIYIKVGDEWVSKSDGANESTFESVKGGLSDSFKRAGIKWGIGRYLYKLGVRWVPAEKKGRYINLKSTPKLPQWALPAGYEGEVGEQYSTTTLGDDDNEQIEDVKYTAEELEEALAVVIPDMGIPFAGKTLEEAAKDDSVGKYVVQFLTGEFKNQSGIKFKPITPEEKELQNSAQIVYNSQN